jgi:acetoin utilization protein AcuC
MLFVVPNKGHNYSLLDSFSLSSKTLFLFFFDSVQVRFLTGITGFVYSDDYLKYNFGPTHPFQPMREKKTFTSLNELGVFNGKVRHYEPEPASEADLFLAHSEEYVKFVKMMSDVGSGYLDYGDTPASKGIYEGSLAVVGGSIMCADLIMNGKVSHAFNPGGGLHHAKSDRAAGFCVFNDIAITVRYIQKRYGVKRIVVVDIDGHHGDGTQEILRNEPVMKIDLHRSGVGFYPGTGFVNEMGDGAGEGYSINVPLPVGTGDEAYLRAFMELVPPLIRSYKPEILLNQFGVDGHYADPLVGLSLTTKTYGKVASVLHDLAHELCRGRYLIFGGGGYSSDNVVRCWATMFLTVAGINSNKLGKVSDSDSTSDDEATIKAVNEVVGDVKNRLFSLHGLNV